MTNARPLTPEALRLPANPGASYLAHRAEIDRAIQRVRESGWYLQGQETEAFEAEFARYISVGHCVSTGSGTGALELALRTLGLGSGDAVVTVSHTAVATVAAIDLVGATPVLLDVNPNTYGMDPDGLAAVLRSDLGPRIKAVIPVHLYGHPAEIGAIQEIAAAHGAAVIEDCAQSHGAKACGRRTGSLGSFGAFSFYPTKNLGALGQGGALVTDDPELAERARMVKEYGWKRRYISETPGMNTRLDELQASILRVKLPHLDAENARRREIAGIYSHQLRHTGLELPQEIGDATHVYHQYVIRTRRRDVLRAHLLGAGVGTAVLYPVPVHLQPGYQERVVIGPAGLRQSEELCEKILSLPMHPALTDADVTLAAEMIACWCEREERS